MRMATNRRMQASVEAGVCSKLTPVFGAAQGQFGGAAATQQQHQQQQQHYSNTQSSPSTYGSAISSVDQPPVHRSLPHDHQQQQQAAAAAIASCFPLDTECSQHYIPTIRRIPLGVSSSSTSSSATGAAGGTSRFQSHTPPPSFLTNQPVSPPPNLPPLTVTPHPANSRLAIPSLPQITPSRLLALCTSRFAQHTT